MKKITSIFGAIVILCSFSTFAQDLRGYDRTIIPPSPNASSLGKFADIPVSLYTGTPDISIPIWQLNQGGLTLPISLSYHASGIKVDEMAPWNGLGWALNAGGVITRTIRGVADEKPNGFFRSGPIPNDYGPTTRNYFVQCGTGYLDAEPDLFYFNFGGRSGKFVLDKNRQVHIIPFQKISIKWIDEIYWEVITEDGTTYLFEEREKLETLQYIQGSRYGEVERDVVSSWYLTKIILPNHGEISLSYYQEPEYSRYNTGESEKKYYLVSTIGNCGGNVGNSTSFTQIDFRAIHLATITWSSGKIEFLPGDERKDLPKDHVLKEIVVKNLDEQVVKRFLLQYDNNTRLFLTSVSEVSKDGSQIISPYRFEYFSGLVGRNSKAQDHWGYDNGAVTNNSLIPTIVANNGIYAGAVRGPSLESCRRGTLNKITYPTGGNSTFEFELHDYSGGVGQSLLNAKKESISHGIQYHLQEYNMDSYGPLFEINDITGKVKADISIGFTGETFCCFYFEIWRFEGEQPVEKVGITYDDPYDFQNYASVFLPNGKYKIKHSVTSTDYLTYIKQNYAFYIDWNVFTSDLQNKCGGLRIKKITSLDDETGREQIKTYTYLKPNTQVSSGSILNTPEYAHDFPEYLAWATGMSCSNMYLCVSSNSFQPLANTQGSFVGYKDVSVYEGDIFSGSGDVNGRTDYTYTSPEEYPDDIYVTLGPSSYVTNSNISRTYYPYAPVDCMDWKRGLLKKGSEF